jgi:hypothetical protein
MYEQIDPRGKWSSSFCYTQLKACEYNQEGWIVYCLVIKLLFYDQYYCMDLWLISCTWIEHRDMEIQQEHGDTN